MVEHQFCAVSNGPFSSGVKVSTKWRNYMETCMFFCKCVHESTITCVFPCIAPFSAHFWPPLEKGPLRQHISWHYTFPEATSVNTVHHVTLSLSLLHAGIITLTYELYSIMITYINQCLVIVIPKECHRRYPHCWTISTWPLSLELLLCWLIDVWEIRLI